MAGFEASKVLFAELVLFADDLSETDAPGAQKLRKMLKEIRKAVEDERAEAIKELQTLKLEHDNGVVELATANADRQKLAQRLEQARDEVKRLKQEVQAFENTATGSKKRNLGVGPDHTLEGPATPLSNGTASMSTRSEMLPPTEIAAAPRRQSSLSPMESSERAHDPRRALFPSSALRTSTFSATMDTGLDRCRQAEPPVSPSATSTKRRRTSTATASSFAAHSTSHASPTSNDSNAANSTSTSTSTSALLAARIPVCGTCARRNARRECDGRARCGRCVRRRHGGCVYSHCPDGERCANVRCDYLHPQQWDDEREGGRRITRVRW